MESLPLVQTFYIIFYTFTRYFLYKLCLQSTVIFSEHGHVRDWRDWYSAMQRGFERILPTYTLRIHLVVAPGKARGGLVYE